MYTIVNYIYGKAGKREYCHALIDARTGKVKAFGGLLFCQTAQLSLQENKTNVR